MKVRIGNSRLRRPAGLLNQLAVAILGCLLLVHLVHVAFGLLARSHVVAQVAYAFDRHFDVDWVGDSSRTEIVSALRDAMPEFRRRQPIIDAGPGGLIVIVIIRGDVAANSVFEGLKQRLNQIVREKYQLGRETNPVSLSELHVTPYAWFKPLDFVAALVLLGSILAWVIYWRPLESTGTPKNNARTGGRNGKVL